MHILRVNIDVAGISTDGDSRCLMAMRSEMSSKMDQLFVQIDICYIQDIIHVGTKLRNRLLKLGIVLPMGCKQISVTHLKMLIQNVAKEKHGLVPKDVCPDDRQNFGSLEKVMKTRVLDTMASHVIDSEATVMYLRLCEKITSSFRDIELTPLERIERIWHALFYLRIWRQWIKKSQYSLSENFITLNAYACVEINAHGIIQIMRKFRDNGDDNLFLSALFESQPCEQTFRQLRSMTTLNWTKVNFTVLELTHMASRIDLQNDIIYSRMKNSGIVFPRIENRTEKMPHFALPSDEEILTCIQSAKKKRVG